MSQRYSKRRYRNALYQIHKIIEITQDVISQGDSEGREYSFLDQVTIYENAMEVLQLTVKVGLKAQEGDNDVAE